jgi:RsiW-degrading membrane proteinase PrsW (M82 family)
MSVTFVVLQAGGYVDALVFIMGAIVYGLVSYFTKRTRPDGEPFKPRKLLRTIIIGVVVGLFAWQQGVALDLANFWELATAIGAPAIAERILQLVYRSLRNVGVIPDAWAEIIYPESSRRR